jgi:hypothetical protein
MTTSIVDISRSVMCQKEEVFRSALTCALSHKLPLPQHTASIVLTLSYGKIMNVHIKHFLAALPLIASQASYAAEAVLEHHVQTFLTALNGSGGKPLEQLSPQDARQVLIGAQASVPTTCRPSTSVTGQSARTAGRSTLPPSARAAIRLYSCPSTAAGYWVTSRRSYAIS